LFGWLVSFLHFFLFDVTGFSQGRDRGKRIKKIDEKSFIEIIQEFENWKKKFS